jgi:non-specific serine/threonine protein kinase
MASAEADLERKPLEVLIYLLPHAGEVCTKEELFSTVWPGRVLSEAVLTKCIGELPVAQIPHHRTYGAARLLQG